MKSQSQRILIISVFIVASCGLAYELIIAALASYLLGDSILQFSSVIGLYLFSMGIGAHLTRYIKEEDTLSYEMEQVPAKIISKRLSKIEKITRAAIEASFAQELGQKFIVSLEGRSSEGEMFYAAKKALWDKDIDGEILINESDVDQLEIGGRYWCEITQVAGSQALGKITAKA